MKPYCFLLSFFLTSGIAGISQNNGTLSGKVIDGQSNQPLASVSIYLAYGKLTTVTNANGEFIFQGVPKGTYQLQVSHVGYLSLARQVVIHEAVDSKLDLALEVAYEMGEEVVVAATRRPQNLRKVPAFLQVIGQPQLKRFSGSNVLELMSEVAGIEYSRAGVDYMTINARGFNSAFNNKVLQMVDGRVSMSALSGSLAMFNNGTTSKEDIERVEVVLGPQSAMYGPNALNAVVNYVSKDPRRYEGTTVGISGGTQSQFSARLRHAQKVNEHWAYKINGEYASGNDFTWYDSVRAGGNAGPIPNGFGPPVKIPERNVDFGFSHLRGEASVYYQLKPGVDIIATGGTVTNNFMQVTTSGRNQMIDFTNSFAQLSFTHPNWYANVYHTWGNIGNSYVIPNYTRNYHNRTNSIIRDPNSPLFPNFGYLAPEVADEATKNPFKQEGKRINAELRYQYEFAAIGLGITAAAFFQRELPNGFGQTLVDGNQKIKINQYSGALQADQKLAHQMRLSAALRWDKHDVFGGFLSPRFALVRDFPQGHIRIGWGKAIAMPSILTQFSNINGFLFGNGPGITYVPNGADVRDAGARKTTTPLVPEQVATWELGYKGLAGSRLLLDVNAWYGRSRNFLSPALGVGGRALSVGDYQVQMNPAFAGLAPPPGYLLTGATFFTYFNFGKVDAYGIDLAWKYKISQHYFVQGNYSWFDSDITKGKTENDGNKDGTVSAEEKSLNAPHHRGFIGLTAQELGKWNWFATAGVRMVQTYDFYSGSQVSTKTGEGTWAPNKNFDWGPLGGFVSVDVRAGFQPTKILSFNMGITNLFNTPQREFAGSPEIGRLLMVEAKVHLPAKPKRRQP